MSPMRRFATRVGERFATLLIVVEIIIPVVIGLMIGYGIYDHITRADDRRQQIGDLRRVTDNVAAAQAELTSATLVIQAQQRTLIEVNRRLQHEIADNCAANEALAGFIRTSVGTNPNPRNGVVIALDKLRAKLESLGDCPKRVQ